MTRKHFQSTFFRLLLGVLLLVLVVVGPLAVISLSTYRASLEKHYKQEVRIVAAGLASAAFNAAASRDIPSLQAIVDEVAGNTPVDVAFVVDREGKIWAHTDGEQFGRKYSPTVYEELYFDEALPLTAGRQVLGSVHAGILRTRLEEEISGPQQALVVVFVFALLVAAGLTVVFSSSTARPLRQLTEVARAIAGGRLDAPLGEIGGPLEVREMAHSFGEMRDSLVQHMERLETSYRDLDRKVHDISILYNVAEAMNIGGYSEGVLDTITGEAVAGVKGLFGAILVTGEHSSTADRLVASRGIDRRNEQDLNRHLAETVAAQCLEGQAIATRKFAGESNESGQDIHVCGVLLVVGSEPGGTLIAARMDNEFSPEDLVLLEALGSQAARCVERARLYAASITDGLTGLYVSRYFRMRLNEELRSVQRYKHSMSLLMVDIDHFKKVNDTYGHQGGDEVLRVVSRCILDTIREDIDIGARYGGEEFAIILPETTRDGARILAERLRQLIEKQEVVWSERTIRVTVSVGLATAPEHGVQPEVVTEHADQALYAAKHGGRNQVVVAGD